MSSPATLRTPSRLKTGDQHSVALTRDGLVVTWGGNRYGQLDVPPGLTNIVGISAGGGVTAVFLAQTPAVRARFLPMNLRDRIPQLDLLAEPGRQFEIHSSSDLGAWQLKATLTNATGWMRFRGSSATNSPTRFYRAMMK